ncbi:Polyprenol-phosphate-mannose-dependent alpha-(1-2)-phosphatidylinositol mannoside mannosyltransferase [Corynebacterium capitovis DSM 44611]|uniref:glycosyltransferase 87 family protein n=1 Tax=Corynebacterium capitovis TaxID=131081 RepID=UPI000373B3DF|nr:glycosyltransferase 87 family protein [Corynebacterium capitovis]WKD58148.1 Polyprenol-phosphate-mannose-dependent alpha-(1-2)-phosphatidylinositol mannoside mannosyltransferase [Corynebacterium capitovis DSM 44611]
MNRLRVIPCIVIALMTCWHLFDVGSLPQHLVPSYHIDTDVYREGGRAVLSGAPLYQGSFALRFGTTLPFTYPPFAALVFAVFALVPLTVASTLVIVASVAAAWLCTYLLLRRIIPGDDVMTWSVWATAALLLTEPIYQNLGFGQVNVFLAALVIVDVFVLAARPRWAGSLVGVAMAIKLTPAVFLAVFFVRRKFRAMFTALASFVLCGLLAFVILPRDSREYWTSTLSDSGRIGNLSYAANQSLQAFLLRVLPDAPHALWIAGVVVIIAVLWVVMERVARRTDNDVVLVLLASSAALLCSPVSWSHHFVWLSLAAVVLTALRRWVIAGVTWVILMACGHWWVPPHHSPTDHWNGWQQIVGNDLFYLTVFLIAYAGWWAFRGTRERGRSLRVNTPS